MFVNKLKNLKGILKKLTIKGIKAFIDDNFREKVIPVEGSVVYTDLIIFAEHSGIYIGNNEISNILVEKFAEGIVRKSNPDNFTDKSLINSKIYVSCNKKGAVGNINVGKGAESHIGERSFYGLVFSNCHSFSEKCLAYSKNEYSNFDIKDWNDVDETWESTIKNLKKTARKKLGATKWKLWDWKTDKDNKIEKPNINEIKKYYENMILNEESIKIIKMQIAEGMEYMEEISDENLPTKAIDILKNFKAELEKIDKKYEEVKEFIEVTGIGISYKELNEINEDFSKLVSEMKNNINISKIVEKLGREYISEEKKQRHKVIKRNENEIFGIHRSNDLVRLLPSEYVNFESEELEYLFYAKYLEKNLLTYEIAGKSKEKIEFENEKNRKKGPVIVCLDTSGSMEGIPIMKAKALLLSISKILEKENRNLYILLFGDSNQIKELNVNSNYENNKILPFLSKGYGGGTDFETSLKRGIEIIEEKKDYNKADILMITDGMCGIGEKFKEKVINKKIELDFSIYTIICNENKIKDDFSDEIINI